MNFKKVVSALVLGGMTAFSQAKHDILLEAKGAYFLASGQNFKEIYHKGGGLYGAELTACVHRQWYGFISADFFNKQGHTLSFDSPTKAKIINLGIGLKYFIPFDCGDFYFGLGALPTRLHTNDRSPYVPTLHTNWGCGGVAKVGAILDLAECFFLDLFFDYAFTKINFAYLVGAPTALHQANVGGCWFGAGVGLRFN